MPRIHRRLFLGAALAGISVFFACKHQLPAPPATAPAAPGTPAGTTCSPDTVYFQQAVLPILVSNCTLSGCHDAASHQDGVVLTDYNRIMATAGIRPGQPRNSDLYEMITDSDPSERMPLGRTPLTQAQIDIIYKWIAQGARNNSCASCDTAGVTFNASIRPLIATKCGGCHGGTAPQGGINFSTYGGVKAKVDDGRLWGAINHLSGYSAMPRNGAKLTDCELTQFRKWIAAGAPNN